MIQVTEKATEVLLEALKSKTDDEAQGIRLTRVAGQGFGLGVDAAREGDQVVEHEGRKVLLVEEDLGGELDGAVLDAEESPGGPRLTIQAPEAEV